MPHGLEVVVRVTLCSDHLPIFLQLTNRFSKTRQQRKFRFEAEWDLHVRCRDIIAGSWEGNQHYVADPWPLLSRKMEDCKKSLIGWLHEEMEKPRWKVNEKKKEAGGTP